MPHIRIRALPESTVQKLSSELPKELALILKTPIDNFTVEKIASQFYRDGKAVEGDPMIEILWFDRGQEQQNQAAKKTYEIVKAHCNAEYIAVVFTPLGKSSYYENGEHF